MTGEHVRQGAGRKVEHTGEGAARAAGLAECRVPVRARCRFPGEVHARPRESEPSRGAGSSGPPGRRKRVRDGG